jgi:hypothetical protein
MRAYARLFGRIFPIGLRSRLPSRAPAPTTEPIRHQARAVDNAGALIGSAFIVNSCPAYQTAGVRSG